MLTDADHIRAEACAYTLNAAIRLQRIAADPTPTTPEELDKHRSVALAIVDLCDALEIGGQLKETVSKAHAALHARHFEEVIKPAALKSDKEA